VPTVDPTKLPEAQREIMEIIWDHQEISVFQVREILALRRVVSRTAVRTMMERLEAKGWLAHRVIGRTYFYRPLVSRETSLGRRVLDLVDKACGGEPERLMAALVEHRGLSQEEVARIELLLKNATKSRATKKGTRK
jgi:predicted transcriptional regulator